MFYDAQSLIGSDDDVDDDADADIDVDEDVEGYVPLPMNEEQVSDQLSEQTDNGDCEWPVTGSFLKRVLNLDFKVTKNFFSISLWVPEWNLQ